MTDSLNNWLNRLEDGTLPNKRHRMSYTPYTPEPPKRSPTEWAREVARGFKGISSKFDGAHSVHVLDSSTLLPDEDTATKVAAILDRLVKRDIAQKLSMHPDELEREVRSSTKKTMQGVTFSYKAYEYDCLQNIRWDVIIAHIKDQSPGGLGGGR